MTLTAQELEKQRTVKELRAFVERIRDSVSADRSEFEFGMAKRGYYKEFLDEVEPLCNFAEAEYPTDFKLQPVLGNQGLDAIVFDSDGTEVDRVEFTKPHDGAAAAVAARQVVTRGYSDIQVQDLTEVLEEFFPFFEKSAKAKSAKDYSGVTVVFYLASPPPITGAEAVFERQVERLRGILAARTFKAKRVLLYVNPARVLPVGG
jgi:hypothetical protein